MHLKFTMKNITKIRMLNLMKKVLNKKINF